MVAHGLTYALIVRALTSFLVAAVAWRLKWLSRSGAWAAGLVGAAVFGFSGWQGAALLLSFFITSSLLSRLPQSWGAPPDGADDGASGARAPSKGHGDSSVVDDSNVFGDSNAVDDSNVFGDSNLPSKSNGCSEMDGPRNGRQVLANGAVAAVAAIVLATAGVDGARLALAGAFAAATADTWASEIGRRIGGTPRSALTMRVVEPGESGGVTLSGTIAGVTGAALIGWVAQVVWPHLTLEHSLALEAAGFVGMWVDSLLGATLQFRGYCPVCRRSFENPAHIHPLNRLRGSIHVTNDAVNWMATLTGALVAVLLEH